MNPDVSSPTSITNLWCLRKIPQSFGTNMESCLLRPPATAARPLFNPLWSRCLQHPRRSQGCTCTETPSGSVLQLCMWVCARVCVFGGAVTHEHKYTMCVSQYICGFICINPPLLITCTCVCTCVCVPVCSLRNNGVRRCRWWDAPASEYVSRALYLYV